VKIKEVMERTGLTDRAIRLYITSGLLHPNCTESYSGRKSFEFGCEDVEELQKIALLRKAGFSLDQIAFLQKGGREAGDMLRSFLNEKRNSVERGHKIIEALESLESFEEITMDVVCERINVSFDAEDVPEEDSSGFVRSLECPYCHTVFGGSPWCPNCKQAPFPMKWFKFLIYFWLFACAAVYVLKGLELLALSTNTLFTAHKTDPAAIAYLIYAFLYFVLAVSAVVTRFQLAGYKENAPTLTTLYFAAEGTVVVSAIWVDLAITQGWSGNFGAIELVFYIALTVMNYFYFNRRVELFVY